MVNLVYGPARVVKPGDPARTADNIRASATLFRVGFVSNLVAATCWLLTAMVLYLLLQHAHRLAAAAMVTFVAVGTAISCLSLANQYTALTIATDQTYTGALGKAGSDALAFLFLDRGPAVDAVFFGLWLLPLGWLVIKSGYFPRTLGILLIIGCFGYLADLFTTLLAPDRGKNVAAFLLAPGPVSELVFIAWLLVMAVRTPATEPAPAATALNH
jgi:hypothetical protein